MEAATNKTVWMCPNNSNHEITEEAQTKEFHRIGERFAETVIAGIKQVCRKCKIIHLTKAALGVKDAF